jgi:hypothetical protein
MSVEKDAQNESFESAKTFWLKHKSPIVKEIKNFTKLLTALQSSGKLTKSCEGNQIPHK